jgi:hypothetical protein
MLHSHPKEHGTIALEMLAIANGEKRLEDLGQPRPAFDRFALSQVLAVQGKKMEGI